RSGRAKIYAAPFAKGNPRKRYRLYAVTLSRCNYGHLLSWRVSPPSAAKTGYYYRYIRWSTSWPPAYSGRGKKACGGYWRRVHGDHLRAAPPPGAAAGRRDQDPDSAGGQAGADHRSRNRACGGNGVYAGIFPAFRHLVY